MNQGAAAPLIFLVAGEASGDVIGGHLMAALKRRTGGAVRFAGVGGPRMIGEGLISQFPIAELGVMGLAEVVPHIPRLLRRIREVAENAHRLRPAVVVTIDSPDFSFRVQKRLHKSGLRRIHIVAPQVWAYRPGRAAKLSAFIDHLLVLLPFEPPFFERHGLACSFMGHPAIEEGLGSGDPAAFRARYGIAPQAPIVVLLPGSRRSEVARMLPVFAAAAKRLRAAHPDLQIVLLSVSHLVIFVRELLVRLGLEALVVEGRADKLGAFAAGRVALAASGTVTLELGLAGLPMVVGYRMNPLTAAIARRVVRVPHVAMVNLILGRALVPELLLGACTPERLTPALDELLVDGAARRAQIDGFKEVAQRLRAGESVPSEQAAGLILNLIGPRAGGK